MQRLGVRRAVGFAALFVAGFGVFGASVAVAFYVASGLRAIGVDPGGTIDLPVFAAVALGPAVAICVCMRRARRRDPQALDWRPIAAGAFLPVLVLGTGILAAKWATDWRHRRSFTQAAWTANSPRRIWLADDLAAGGTLLGRTRDEVIALLGPPDAGDAPASDSRPDEWSLGGGRGFMDEDFLVVEYGADGRVVRVQVESRSW